MQFFPRINIWAWVVAGAAIALSGCGSGSMLNGNGSFVAAPTGQPAAVASVVLAPASVTGGSPAQITVTMAEAAPAAGLSVALSSSDPSVASAPQSLAIAAGQTTATGTVPTSPVSEATTLTISASYNGSMAGANLSVMPDATGTFTVSAQPASVTVQQGNSGTSTISTKAASGFDKSVALSVSGAPVGVTASLSPKSIPAPGSGTSKLTMTVGSSTQTGSYPLSVKATGGGITKSATVTLKVTSGSANPNATFKGCWFHQGGHRFQGVDVSVKNAGTYPFNAVLYNGATCNPNDWADQFGFGQLIDFGSFQLTFWFSDFEDQTNMSAIWSVGDENSQCVNYTVAPNC